MIFTEWNWNDAKAVWQEEAEARGKKKERNFIKSLFKRGLSKEEILKRL